MKKLINNLMLALLVAGIILPLVGNVNPAKAAIDASQFASTTAGIPSTVDSGDQDGSMQVSCDSVEGGGFDCTVADGENNPGILNISVKDADTGDVEETIPLMGCPAVAGPFLVGGPGHDGHEHGITVQECMLGTRTSDFTLDTSGKASVWPGDLCTSAFNDVPDGSPFYNEVRALACRGMVSGFSDGTFRAGDPVTRGQAAKMIANAAGFTGSAPGQTFEDVKPGSTFYDYVERLASRAIVGGFPCGGPGEQCVPPADRPYFRPGNPVTRGQLSKMVGLSVGFNGTPSGQTFADVPPGHPFYDYVESAAGWGVIGGYACSGQDEPCDSANRPYFRPGNSSTRGQTAKIVRNGFIPTAAPPAAKWTVLFYGSGDNSLEQCIASNVEQMEQVGSSDDLNIVAMVDDDGNPAHNNTTCNGYGTDGAYRARIIRHVTPGGVHVRDSANPDLNPDYEPLADDPNMGDPNTLRDFIKWGVRKYPARNYMLVIGDHGLGWQGLSQDVTSEDGVGAAGDWMGMDELYRGLEGGGALFRVIAFDACSMAELEAARQVWRFGDVMVASQDCEPDLGFPYDTMMTALNGHLNWDGAALGSDMVNRYATAYNTNADITISAVRLNMDLNRLTNAVSDLGTQLRGDNAHHGVDDYHSHLTPNNNVQIGIHDARSITHEPGMKFCTICCTPDDSAVDLRDLTDKVNAEARIDAAYKAAIPAVQNSLTSVVINEKHGAHHNNGAHGLNLYFPRAEALVSASTVITYDAGSAVGTLYARNPGWDPSDRRTDPPNHPLPAEPNFLFTMQTQWDEFLYRYYEPVADAGPNQATVVGGTVNLDASGSSEADGVIIRYVWDFNPAANSDNDDHDRDGNVVPGPEADDDQDVAGVIVPFECPAAGLFLVRLMVRDNHELYYPDPNRHFNVDDDYVTVTCLPLPETYTPTYTPSSTLTPSPTRTPTGVPTGTATITSVPTHTATPQLSPTNIATASATTTSTPTRTATTQAPPTSAATASATRTVVPTGTVIGTRLPVGTPSRTSTQGGFNIDNDLVDVQIVDQNATLHQPCPLLRDPLRTTYRAGEEPLASCLLEGAKLQIEGLLLAAVREVQVVSSHAVLILQTGGNHAASL